MEAVKLWITCMTVVLCMSVYQCEEIQCYDCIYFLGFNDACGEDFDSGAVPLMSCNGTCTKLVGSSDFGDVIVRSCDYGAYVNYTGNAPIDYCASGSSEEGEGTMCACSTDHCNHGNAVTWSLPAMLFSTVLAVLVLHK